MEDGGKRGGRTYSEAEVGRIISAAVTYAARRLTTQAERHQQDLIALRADLEDLLVVMRGAGR